MKIYLAKTAGFCMGVNRAINKALELSESGDVIFTWGPVIHNPQVIDDLKRKKVHCALNNGILNPLYFHYYCHGILVFY